MRLRNNPKANEILENHKDIVVFNPNENKGKWHDVFGNDHPIYIEIGTVSYTHLDVYKRQHYDRDEDKVHQVEKGFDYYGTIHEYVKSLERNQINELTTNALYYMNRDVYVNKDDDSYIYVRMDKDNYSLLYYDDATENKVLKIIQANQ